MTNTYYTITNKWDDRTWCNVGEAWVNDGRTIYKTHEEAEVALKSIPEEDQASCYILECKLDE